MGIAARRMLIGCGLVGLLFTACPRGTEEVATDRTPAPTPLPTPEPTPEPAPDFELTGTVRFVLPASEFAGALAAPTVEEPSDPEATPTPTPEATPETERGPGALVVELATFSPSLQGCGYGQGDAVVVVLAATVAIEPAELQEDQRFPANLSGEGVELTGQIEDVEGRCVLVGRTLVVGATATATPTPRPAARTTPRPATPRPATPTPLVTPTPTPTGPTPTPGASPTPEPTPTPP